MSNKQNNSNKGAAASRPRFPLWRVCLVFLGLVLGLHLFQWTLAPRPVLTALQEFTAQITATAISASGIPVKLDGTSLFLLGEHWEVILECTALSAFYVFLSFVAAYPSKLKSKALGLVLGLPALFFVNIIRLFALAWATRWSPMYAPLVHDYIWQIAFLLLLVLMWLTWIELVVRRESRIAVSG
ncbi:MAG: exosortase/archaeosortase family protein [Desulfuromonadales bacterium]|nr:exosortase/archaeosortase family protein [Desulfuromonadales bacterium]